MWHTCRNISGYQYVGYWLGIKSLDLAGRSAEAYVEYCGIIRLQLSVVKK